ncbi:hypothetical protein CPB97_011828 [Podila verticillata]|nr:hypothetical protein CPB97_011828 [Podila verticillata]
MTQASLATSDNHTGTNHTGAWVNTGLPSPISPALPFLSGPSTLIKPELRTSFSATQLSQLMFTPLPEGPLSNQSRQQLEQERDQLRAMLTDTQRIYQTVQGSIPTFQQLVLTTHAQVAAAKHTLLQARGICSSTNTPSPTSMSACSWPSSACTSPSPSSPALSRAQSFSIALPHGVMDENPNQDSTSPLGMLLEPQLILERLEQEHVALGLKLSQLLREKAEAEETKKKLGDSMKRSKARVREIERKLGE